MMKKLLSLQVESKKTGEEFAIHLLAGDVFISFHLETECTGVYIAQRDLKEENFNKIFEKTKQLLNGKESQIEIKIIGHREAIAKVNDYIAKINFKYKKAVERNHETEVCFFPVVNKVRVAIESAVKAPAKVEVLSKIKRKANEKIKVLVVDDSKTIRTILSKVFNSDPSFEVVGLASLPSEVEGLIMKHRPDVITLDIHMPEMDGVTLLKTVIQPKFNIPTVMISSISISEGPLVLDALENGAVDYIQKPEMSELEKVTPVILEKVKTAALANMVRPSKEVKIVSVKATDTCDLDSLIVLGSSTGGTEAIREILTAMPAQIPPFLIVQHIPAVFSTAFANRMNDLCPFEVREAQNGDEVKKNRVLIAPGGKQMKMIHKAGKTFVEINDDEPVNRFRPSVDYLFFSVAESLYTHTVAVILTGMGKDGAQGMLKLKNKGVKTIAQDEETSVVFGMPKEAINLKAADHIEPLGAIAQKITWLTNKKNSKVA